MAFCLANGIDFLGFKTKKVKVLYLDCESPLELAKKRQYLIEKGLQADVDKNNLKYLIGERLDLNSDEGIKKLKFIIKENEAEVVFVDVLRGFLEGINESSADDVREWYQTRIKPLKDELGITIIFITHTRKSKAEDSIYEKWEKIRGSSELVNLADLILMLDRKGFENFAELVCQKNRYGLEAEAFGIVYNFDDENKELRLDKVDKDTWILSQTKYYTSSVLSFLISLEKETFETKEVKEFLKNQKIKSVNTVADRVLKDLVNVGKIRKFKRGLWEIISEKQTTL
jgi:RecA-family ATPase